MHTCLIIFIKNPIPGRVKTRLAQTAGDEAALRIYRYLLDITRQTALHVAVERYLFYSDFIDEADQWGGEGFHKMLQHGASLGERMEHAFEACFRRGAERVVIIGSDCPEITAALLNDAFDQLEGSDFTIGPASDGGYYLLGMKTFDPSVFKDIPWSTSNVLTQTTAVIQRNKKTVHMLPVLTDIDTEEDWLKFQQTGGPSLAYSAGGPQPPGV